MSTNETVMPDENLQTEEFGKKRSLGGAYKIFVYFFGVFASSFHIYIAITGIWEAYKFRAVHFALLVPLAFLMYPFSRRSPRNRFTLPDVGIALVTFLIAGYFGIYKYAEIVQRIVFVNKVSDLDFFLSIILVICVFEAVRRVVGYPMVIVALCILAYGMFGQYLPGAAGHPGFRLVRIFENLVMTPEGIFGIPMGASATFVFLFVLFGAFLEVSGVGDFFMDLACGLAGGTRGGPAKIAVVGSVLFGTIQGSAISNVVSTGTFTIPLMKRLGYPPTFAAAVEASASTGGQIMPPIMGAAAFLLAEFVGIPYISLAGMALVPALLYFASVFLMVHFAAGKMNLKGLDRETLPKILPALKERGLLMLPLVVIVFVMILGYTAYFAAFCAIVSVVSVSIIVKFINKKSKMSVKLFFDALSNGAQSSIMITACCGCSGIIIGVLQQTGIGIKFASLIIALSGGNVYLLLVFVMLAVIIVGLGVPTVAAYILVVALAIPALVESGFTPVAAHLFAFYYACFSVITPPVCLATFAAAGIARSHPTKSALAAVKLASSAFIIPYFFIFNNALLLIGPLPEVILAVITAFVGIFAFSAAIVGFMNSKVNIIERILLLGVSLFLIGNPQILITLLAIVIFVAIVVKNTIASKKESMAA